MKQLSLLIAIIPIFLQQGNAQSLDELLPRKQVQLNHPRGSLPSLSGFVIACSQPGCLMERFLTKLRPGYGQLRYNPMLVGVDGNFFPEDLSRRDRQVWQVVSRRLTKPSSEAIRLSVALNVPGTNSILDITFDRWDGAVSLERGSEDYTFTTPPGSLAGPQPNLVIVSPQSFVEGTRAAASRGDIASTKFLLEAVGSFYPHQDLIATMESATNEGIKDWVTQRITNAKQFEAIGDWSSFTAALKNVPSVHPHARQTIAAELAECLQRGEPSLKQNDFESVLKRSEAVLLVMVDLPAAIDLRERARSAAVRQATLKSTEAENAGNYGEAKAALISGLRLIPDSQELQGILRSINQKTEILDRERLANLEEQNRHVAEAKKLSDLTEKTEACRKALDKKDFASALNVCQAMITAHPSEPSAKVLFDRLKAQMPGKLDGKQLDRTNTPSGSSGPDRAKAGTAIDESQGGAHPYEIFRDPYRYKGRTIRMTVSRVPYVFQDEIKAASASIPGMGHVPLRFLRSLSPRSALFSVMGVNLVSHAKGLSQFGEMIVTVESSNADPSRLEPAKDWIVLCSGIVRGTNQLGGPIDVPQVEFLRYVDGSKAQGLNEEPPVVTIGHDGSATTRAGQSRDKVATHCCSYVEELLRRPFEFKGVKWVMFVDAFPILENGLVKSYARQQMMPGLKFRRAISTTEAVFEVCGMRVGGRPFPLEVIGQIIVEVPASQASQLDVHKPWLIVGLGTTEVINDFGARLQVAKVRFLGYDNN